MNKFPNNSELSGIKAIFLDLDNTLYDYHASHKYALFICSRKFSKNYGVSSKGFYGLYENSKKIVKKIVPTQAASHSRLLYFQVLFENYLGKTNVKATLEYESLYWRSFIAKMVLFNDALNFLKNCKKNKIKICLITDLTARIQFEKIEFLKIAKYIDYIVSSEEVGEEKPSSKIFNLAIQKVRVNRSKILVLGDDYKRDILGAKRMGLRSYLTCANK
ncbi:MAG: HAD family hydrolase [bacterium]|nr:HAD family hydrolase [bacterium]